MVDYGDYNTLKFDEMEMRGEAIDRVQRDFYAGLMRRLAESCRAVDLRKILDEVVEELVQPV